LFAIGTAFCYKKLVLWATSSVVRALPSHGRGPRFKSLVAHHSFSFSTISRPREKVNGSRVFKRWAQAGIGG
jgi:hypothetical protein